MYKSLQTPKNLFLLLLSERCNFSTTILLLFGRVYWTTDEKDRRVCFSVLVYCTFTFSLSCLLLCVIPHPQNSWNQVSLVIPPPPPSPSLHMLFLFLVLVKSGMACVFHHRNRHNRQTQPSSGSVNGDQIKSIIRFLCAKAFFLFPSLSLRHSHLILRAVPAGQGGWWA